MEKEYLRGRPFPYLLNFCEFYNHTFYVDKRVLIPRPETELLVDLLVKSGTKFKKICDVGVGSGVILLSLLKENSEAEGLGVDLSPEALEVAKINTHNLRLTDRTSFLISDRLKDVSCKFDLIVSNPPYIKESSHRHLVQESVNRFEPSLALYLPDEEYDNWFSEFFTQVKNHLTSGGQFMMEGHELEVASQKEKLEALGFSNVKVINDWGGGPRFLQAKNK